ncbi:hypothetical protein NJI34_34685 [Pseudomonas sp. S 311-6]|nr:hypothetical protein [Pseudomonas sp. S 311-6]
MSIDTSKIKDQARDGIAEALGDAYDCMRVWSAWGVGTMGPDDFALVVDDESRLEEITDAALAPALSVIDAQAVEIARLQRIIDSRPAMNAGLLQAYAEWTGSIYAMDFARATETQQ